MTIRKIELRQLSVPLTEPYHLSHKTVHSFDVVLVEVRTGNGDIGFGEVTTLEGYFDQSVDEVWSTLLDTAGELVGRSISNVQPDLQDVTLLPRSALECAVHAAGDADRSAVRAPIVGIASADVGPDECLRTVRSQLEAGFDVIKVKIGFDPHTDATVLTTLTRSTPDSVAFRVDANQGYTREEAATFLEAADTSQLQLLEQPLPVGNLEEHAVLAETADVPIMLDEEVRDSESVDRIAQTDAATMVKVKLMKQGGPAGTRAVVETARDHGFDVVIGNGVQSDIGCIHEAILWEELNISTAAEFNGWRKQVRPTSINGPVFEDGTLRWSGERPTLDVSALEEFCVREEVVS